MFSCRRRHRWAVSFQIEINFMDFIIQNGRMNFTNGISVVRLSHQKLKFQKSNRFDFDLMYFLFLIYFSSDRREMIFGSIESYIRSTISMPIDHR